MTRKQFERFMQSAHNRRTERWSDTRTYKLDAVQLAWEAVQEANRLGKKKKVNKE